MADTTIAHATSEGTSDAQYLATAHHTLVLGTDVIKPADVDDTPVNGADTVPVSSNWAYDHVAAADPHTVYQLEAASFKLEETLASDHTWHGIIADGTAGENVTIFQLCYLKSDGKYWLSDADAAATMPGVALASASIAANASGVIILPGTYVRDDSWAWTVGGLLYADVTPGAMSQTAPSGAGDQVQVVGYALTADIIYFNPSLLFVGLA